MTGAPADCTSRTELEPHGWCHQQSDDAQAIAPIFRYWECGYAGGSGCHDGGLS